MPDIFKEGQEIKQEAAVGSSESSTNQTSEELTKLSKRVQDSQEHISKIEKENAELREKIKGAKTIEDVLDKLHKPEPSKLDQVEDTQKQHDQSKAQTNLRDLVKEELTQLEMQKLARDNGRVVADALRKQFGDKAETVFVTKAKELNLSEEQLHILAATSPKAALGFFALSPNTHTSQSASSVNTDAVFNQQKQASEQTKQTTLIKEYVNSPGKSVHLYKEIEKDFLAKVGAN